MADKIIYNYEEMKNAVTKINEIATRYKTAGTEFNTGFVSATTEWEGSSKDKMLKLINGDVNNMLTVEIPDYLTGLANLLTQNIEQMQKADAAIAESIPEKLG